MTAFKDDADHDAQPPKDRPSFVQFLRSSPLAGLDLRIRRDRSPARHIDLSDLADSDED